MIIELEFTTELEAKGAALILKNAAGTDLSIKWSGVNVEGSKVICQNIPQPIIDLAQQNPWWQKLDEVGKLKNLDDYRGTLNLEETDPNDVEQIRQNMTEIIQ